MSLITEAKSRVSHLRKELHGSNPFAVGLLTADSVLYVKRHRTIIDGYHFPKTGPFIATGNHFNKYDARKAHYRIFTQDFRLPTVVIKRSLIEKGAVESDVFLENLGETKEDATREYDPLVAWVLRGINVVDILRDRPGMKVNRKGHATLKRGRGWALFMQQHRQDDCTLNDLQPGVAYFAKEFPDVPVYPIAFSGPPVETIDRMTVLKPFTYTELQREYRRDLTIPELTIMIADMIVTALPEKSQVDWAYSWSQELKRLNTTRGSSH